MYAWGHLCKDFMISVPHSKPKTGFKNSKRRQCADVMTHDVILSGGSREGVVFNDLKYWVLHSRVEILSCFCCLWPLYYLLHSSNRQEYLGEFEEAIQ